MKNYYLCKVNLATEDPNGIKNNIDLRYFLFESKDGYSKNFENREPLAVGNNLSDLVKDIFEGLDSDIPITTIPAPIIYMDGSQLVPVEYSKILEFLKLYKKQ